MLLRNTIWRHPTSRDRFLIKRGCPLSSAVPLLEARVPQKSPTFETFLARHGMIVGSDDMMATSCYRSRI